MRFYEKTYTRTIIYTLKNNITEYQFYTTTSAV